MWKCNPIREEDSIKYMRTAINIPYFEEPVYYITQDYNYDTYTTLPDNYIWTDKTYKEIVVIWDAFVNRILSLFVSVLRNPRELSLSTSSHCELPTSTHYKITDLAVDLMLENIESQRFQTNTQTLTP
jgi:hypothetical protein